MKTSTDDYLYRHDDYDGDSTRQDSSILSRHLLTNTLLGSEKIKASSLRVAIVRVLLLSGIIATVSSVSFFYGRYQGSSGVSRTIVPELSYREVVFTPNMSFAGGMEPETVAAWDSLMPPGRGFILIEDPSHFNLEPGIPTEIGVERYSVSVFHQLHCLGLIRASYYLAKEGQDGVILHGGSHLNETARNHIHGEHIDHCFDFIRQALMCAADTTIESAAVEKNGNRIQVDGWGTLHQCRDWNMLWEFMVENQAPTVVSGVA